MYCNIQRKTLLKGHTDASPSVLSNLLTTGREDQTWCTTIPINQTTMMNESIKAALAAAHVVPVVAHSATQPATAMDLLPPITATINQKSANSTAAKGGVHSTTFTGLPTTDSTSTIMMPHHHGAVATSPADAEATKDIDPPGGATNPTVAGMVVHDPTMPSTATSMPSAAGIVMATDSNTTPSTAGTVGGGSPTPITDAIDQKSVDGAAATGGVHYIMTSTGAEVISSTMPPPDGAKATNTSTIGPFIGHVWFAQVKCNVLFPHLNYTIRLVC